LKHQPYAGLARRVFGRAIAAFAGVVFLFAVHATVARADGADAFVGTWDTYTSVQPFPHFDLKLTKVTATHLSGTYRPRSVDPLGHLEGDVDASGTRLDYAWSVGALTGTGSFNLVGNQITGQWATDGPTPFLGTWAGSRKGSAPSVSLSSKGITLTAPGGLDVTIPLGGDTQPAPQAGGAGGVPPGLPTAAITTDTNLRGGPGKNTSVVGKLPAGLVVFYEPACPNGYCKVYGNGVHGFVWNQLLDFSGGDGSSGVSPPSDGSEGLPSPPSMNQAGFSGIWKLQLVPDGGTAFTYYMQITQTGNNATAKVNSVPPVNLQCQLSGALLTCSWSDSGIEYSGNFSRAGNQVSGNWTSDESQPLTGTWIGTRM
jgi:hypothetical protein